MMSIGRTHIHFDPDMDLRGQGMTWKAEFPGQRGKIKFRRIGRIVWMTLPKKEGAKH